MRFLLSKQLIPPGCSSVAQEFGCNFSHWLMQCNRQMDLKYFYLIAFPCCAESWCPGHLPLHVGMETSRNSSKSLSWKCENYGIKLLPLFFWSAAEQIFSSGSQCGFPDEPVPQNPFLWNPKPLERVRISSWQHSDHYWGCVDNILRASALPTPKNNLKVQLLWHWDTSEHTSLFSSHFPCVL